MKQGKDSRPGMEWDTSYNSVSLLDEEMPGEYESLLSDKQAVGVIVEGGDQSLLFVQNHRYPAGEMEWEIPTGEVEPEESILEAAKRHVLEETGYLLASPKLLMSYYPLHGVSHKMFHVVKGTGHSRLTDEMTGWEEEKGAKWIARDEVQAMMRANMIKDGLTLTALMYYFLKRHNIV